MGWIGRAAAAIAVATVCLSAGGPTQAQSAAGACRTTCNTSYNACQRRAINGDTCLRRWQVCKRKCQGRPVSSAPPVTAPATK